MKMIKYKTPAILALSRGDALAIRLIMSAVVKLFARPYPHGTVYLKWRLRGCDLLGPDDGLGRLLPVITPHNSFRVRGVCADLAGEPVSASATRAQQCERGVSYCAFIIAHTKSIGKNCNCPLPFKNMDGVSGPLLL